MQEEITYTWNILNLTKKDYEGKPNAIYQVTWEKIGKTNDGHFGIFRTTTGLQVSTDPADSFIEYDSLTESTIISWIKESMAEGGQYDTPEEKELAGDSRINSYIQAQINESKANFTIVRSGFFPWQFK